MTSIDEPGALIDLVDYQDGSVVSQALVKAKTGTVTVFAFDTGEGLSEHTAPFDALLFVAEGRVAVRIGSDEHELSAGQIVRLPAGIPHALSAVTRFKMLLTMIRESSPES
jgi:quercetin dioxygenase-like cupin family protein